MKKRISLLLCILLCLLSISSVAAAGYARNITGEFNNMKVTVNGVSMPLIREPFTYDGEIYVPIMNLSQWLYLNTQYDERNHTVKISTGGILRDATTRTFAGNLLQKDYEIQVIHQQLQKKDSVIEEETRLPYKKINSVEEMENYLQEYFDELYGIPMTFDFRHQSGYRYRLYITFPSGDRDEFEDLSRRTIEDWLEDILYSVRRLYDDRARIDGHIRDNSTSYRSYVSFETDGDDLNFSFRSYSSSRSQRRVDIDEAKLEKHLEKNLSSYSNVDFQYEVHANRYDIDLIVYFHDKDFYNWNTSTRRNYLNRLERELRNFDGRIDTYGKFIDTDKDEEVLRFHFLDSRVDFYDYEPKETTSSSKVEVEKIEKNPVIKRTVTAWFDNISLEVDGMPFLLLKEPLIMDEEIYMPISDLADALYWVFEYVPQEDTLKIQDNNFDSKNFLAFGGSLLHQRDQEKTKLEEELKIKEEEMGRERRTNLPYRNILSVSKMQSYLRDYFEDFEGIEMSISLSRSSGNHYRLRITYDEDDFEIFDAIRKGTIEGWIQDMYDAIKDLYDPNATLSGSIRSTPRDGDDYTYITFDTDYRDRLTFDFEDHGNQKSTSRNIDAAELEKELYRHLRRFRGANFRYDVVVTRRDVDLVIHCTNDSFYRWDMDDKMDYLQELREEIFEIYEDITVNGRIEDPNQRNTFRFSIEDGNIRSYDLMRDVEKYLDKNYGKFSHGRNTFNFTYKIWERNTHAFDVKLEGDFFKEETSWQSVVGDDANYRDFEEYVIDALRFVSNFFEVEVMGEAVDKGYTSLLVKTVNY